VSTGWPCDHSWLVTCFWAGEGVWFGWTVRTAYDKTWYWCNWRL